MKLVLISKKLKKIGVLLESIYIFWFTIGWVLGFLNILVISILIFIILFLSYKSRYLLIMGIVLVGVTIGTVQRIYIENNTRKIELSAQQFYNKETTFNVKVISEPKIRKSNTQYYVEILDKEQKIGNLLLDLPNWPEYEFGNIFEVKGFFKQPENFTNDFDYVEYLQKQNIFLSVGSPKVKKVGNSGEIFDRLVRTTFSIKKYVTSLINKNLHEPYSSLLAGILLGYQSTLPEKFKDELRITGTTHIIAISGYNMTIIVEFISKYGKKVAGKFTNTISSVLIIWFGIMTGMGPPVLRAVISAIYKIVGLKLGRKINPFVSCMWAFILILLINPILIFSISFQLTFGAVLGILFWTPILDVLFQFLPAILKENFVTSMSAFLMTFPVLLYHFGGISLISLISNVLVLPLVEVVMMFGFIAVFLSLFGEIVICLNYVFFVVFIPLFLIKQIITLTARLSFLYFDIEKNSAILIFSIFLLELFLIFVLYPGFQKSKALIAKT